MTLILALGGSPSSPSRSAALLEHAVEYMEARGMQTKTLHVRDLDPRELMHAQLNGPTVTAAGALIAEADGILVTTPVYKASYTGLLKAFLDLLPQTALAGKTVLPVALGGSLAHMLIIDYALRPVLAAMGAYNVLQGIYLLDNAMEHDAGRFVKFTTQDAEDRLHNGVTQLIHAVTVEKQ